MVKNFSPIKNTSSQKGQSLVELALSITVVFILLAGAFEFGMAFFDYIILRDAAQEGALYGSIAPVIDANNNGKYDVGEQLNTAAIIARVRQSSTAPRNLANDTALDEPDICIEGSPCTGREGSPCTGGEITVTLRYHHQLTTPFIGTILGSQEILLTASVTDTILQPACP